MAGIVAVTGAAGFIGSAVVRKLLARGRRVRALLEPGAPTKNLDTLGNSIERVTVDICDFEGMTRALDGCDVLYHLAAMYRVWLPDPNVIYKVNLEGTMATLLAAQRVGTPRIVYTSSIAAVGLHDDGTPANENVEYNLHHIASEYIQSKYLSERLAMRFVEAGMPIVVVNPGFPFGEGDVGPTPTGKIIISLLRKEVPGVGEGGFCAIDVNDVAEGHILAEEKGRIGERYILANHNVNWRDFFGLVCKIGGVRPPMLPLIKPVARAFARSLELVSDTITHKEPLITLRSLLYMQRYVFFDNSKARRELGLPVTPLEDSIERSIRYFRSEGALR